MADGRVLYEVRLSDIWLILKIMRTNSTQAHANVRKFDEEQASYHEHEHENLEKLMAVAKYQVFFLLNIKSSECCKRCFSVLK